MSQFGDCCSEMRTALTGDFNKLIAENDGILYLAVGYVVTEKGPGWFDSAVLFCPFCGTKIQDRAEIAARVAGKQ